MTTETRKLVPEFKADWLRALRSGEYCQSAGWLRRNNGFCCLGVALDVLDPTKWQKGPVEYYTYEGDQASYIRAETCLAIGLDPGEQQTLAEMNDKGRSFTEIADYIEANL